jgi:hypothetical protein
MSAMTGDVRDRILALLSAGPASVARLSAGLGVPGGVVSYELKLLERDGLVRVGTTRREQGVATPLYVSTVAAAPPPLAVPPALPGLTWIGNDPYPTPLWTVPHLPDPPAAPGPGAAAPPDPTGAPAGPDPSEPELEPFAEVGPDSIAGVPAVAYTGIRFPTRPRRAEAANPEPSGPAERAHPAASRPVPGQPREETPAGTAFPRPPQPRRPDPESPRGPRLHEMRRVPMDDATFHEFATRLDALAREFAARATPGAPATELTVRLTRPDGDPAAGHGYGYGS